MHNEQIKEAWGSDITIIVFSDYNYLPGVYGLFNSAIINGFAGLFRIIKLNNFDSAAICKHVQLEVDILEKSDDNYYVNVQRLTYLKKLHNGKYLFLDADIIIERPLNILTELIDKSILVSKEPEPKYDSNDILYQRQAIKAGYNPFNGKDIGYINGGMIGFKLPQHQVFVNEFLDKSFSLLSGIKITASNPDWFFIDQDMLNVVLRNVDIPVSVISPRQLEIRTDSKTFYNRKFPYQEQTNLFPKDQLKYIIHGAALRRPWLNIYSNNLKGYFRNKLYTLGINGLLHKPAPYERAWAYYTCTNKENLPIKTEIWAKQHQFTAYKNILWRKAHGL